VGFGVGVGRCGAHRVLGQGAQHRARVPVPGVGGHRRGAVGPVLLGAGGGQAPLQHPGGAVHTAQPGVVLTAAGGRGHRVCVLLNVAAAEPGRGGHRAIGPRSYCLLRLLLLVLVFGGGGVGGTLGVGGARPVRGGFGAQRLR